MKLDVILRTHSTGNVHQGERYVGTSKEEVMLRCVYSLVRSMNEADADIRVSVVDDRSTPDALKKLRDILQSSKHPTEIRQCDAKIQNESTMAHFSVGLERGREIVYLVEDDYLHAPSAISEMLDAYTLFKKNLGRREVALYPTDYLDRYNEMDLCRIVLGPKRHWRTITRTTNTCWLSHALLRKRWSEFEALAKGYGVVPGIGEDNTINKIWREDAVVFSPIPTLALHVQFDVHKDPYVDWQSWWNSADYRE